MMMVHRPDRRLSAAVAAVLLIGCDSPQPRDLSGAANLTPPSGEELQVLLKGFSHPILRPVAFDDRDGLSADEAAILAVLSNPALRASRTRRRIAEAQVLQAGLLPNPELTTGFDFPVTTEVKAGYGFGLSWEVTSLLQRAAHQDAASAHAGAVDLEVAWQEWQVAQAARMHVLRLAILKGEVAAAAAVAENLRANLELVRRALELGGASALDLAAAETAHLQAETSHLGLEQEERSERLELDRALGLPPDASVRLEEAPAFADVPVGSASEVLEGIEARRLDLVALRHGYESQEARLRAAVRGRFPKIRLGVLGGRDAGEVETLNVGVSVELPIFDRNQGALAFEEATRDTLFEEYRSRLFEARHQTAQILADMEATRRRLALLESGLESLRPVVSALEERLRQGTIAGTDYYQIRREFGSKELEAMRLRRLLTDLRIGLEIAAGRYFPQT